MLRKLLLLAVVFAVGGSELRADVFYSGTVTANGGVAPGGSNFALSKTVTLAGGGVSYNNVFGDANTGASFVGATISSVGIVKLDGAQFNSFFTQSFGTGDQLVAVYALQGKIDSIGPAGAKANFQVESGGRGAVGIFVRNDNAITANNPAGWVTDINSPVAMLGISDLPSALLTGFPGPFEVVSPVVGNINNLNTATADFSTALATSTPQFKLDITDPGTFFSDFAVSPLPPDGSLSITSFAALLNLNQRFEGVSIPLDDAALGLLNAYMQALLGDPLAMFAAIGGTNLGANYTPNVNAPFSGDASLTNTGGDAIPGAQFAPNQEIPEPASIILWGALTVAGGAYGARRRRLANKA